MHTITPLRRRSAAPESAIPGDSGRHPGRAGFPHPDGQEIGGPKFRGPKLAALWIGLVVGAWGVVGGAGYGLYSLASSLLR